jgi:hypothetical protein
VPGRADDEVAAVEEDEDREPGGRCAVAAARLARRGCLDGRQVEARRDARGGVDDDVPRGDSGVGVEAGGNCNQGVAGTLDVTVLECPEFAALEDDLGAAGLHRFAPGSGVC